MSKSKKLFIIQSNYIPWKGYFDALNYADIVVIYDEMQFTKNDWRNRNLIKTPSGTQWLSVPVVKSGKFGQKINETLVTNDLWKKKHWKSIKQNYSKAKYFNEVSEILEPLYTQTDLSSNLSDINVTFINTINDYLGIRSKIVMSKNLELEGDKNERIITICEQLGVQKYISGPAAKNYMIMDHFKKAKINVEFLDYSGYPEYNQLFGEFTHQVSIIDLLYNEGKGAMKFLKYAK